jgi:hypothetical protein
LPASLSPPGSLKLCSSLHVCLSVSVFVSVSVSQRRGRRQTKRQGQTTETGTNLNRDNDRDRDRGRQTDRAERFTTKRAERWGETDRPIDRQTSTFPGRQASQVMKNRKIADPSLLLERTMKTFRPGRYHSSSIMMQRGSTSHGQLTFFSRNASRRETTGKQKNS